MVRVISVHHFAGQHIQTVEQPTACTVAPPDKLLLALTSNCIEVRDLKNESDVLFTFPTVDEVVQIVHCRNGDFVATLETKFNRQNKDTNFVRVYINWDSVAALQQSKMTSSGVSLGSSECGMVQPMRARIAGRVTPTTNQSELGSLEMIEIPVKANPNYIECCQVSGNLFILSNRTITIYKFQVKTHDISKKKFVDFFDIPMVIELSFAPAQMAVCENYIGCMNQDHMYLFKLVVGGGGDGDLQNGGEQEFSFNYSNDEPIDYDKLKKEEFDNFGTNKLTVHLPSIIRENSIVHKHSPFTFTDKEMQAKIHGNTLNYEIKNLIQLKLIPILVESAQRHITEEFKCMILKPLYIEEVFNKNQECHDSALNSDYRKCLNSVVCMVATQQEGYLHYFNEMGKVSEKSDISGDNCIAVYPFTAPVHQLVMEDYFLHALTETGLESYTLRFGHQLFRNIEIIDNINVACPSIQDSICLVGLRPFLGVEKILLCENNLLLLASCDSSPTHSISSNSSSNAAYWTLYNLELPHPKAIFNEISIVANIHRFTSAQTYCHLMSESHIILRVALMLKQWTVVDDNVKLILPTVKDMTDVIVETYRTSCALLGDHYVMCTNLDDYKLAIPYYKMAQIPPNDVVKRVRKIQEQSNNYVTKGLVHYLKVTLMEVKHLNEAEKFAEKMLVLLENDGDLPDLIIKSAFLREFSTDRLIGVLTERLSNQSDCHFALTILHIQKCNLGKAHDFLRKIPENELKIMLINNWELLFDSTQSYQNKNKTAMTFSELAVILIGSHPDLLSEILVFLIIDKKSLNLHKLIKVFLEYLPSSIGSDGSSASILLQKTLELYFCQYVTKIGNTDIGKIIYERGANEAMKLLVRSYLSQLQILQLKEENNKHDEMTLTVSDDFVEIETGDGPNRSYFDDKTNSKNESYLFGKFRYEYLDKMPPFQLEITSKLYAACLESYEPKPVHRPNKEGDLILKKLQAILSSNIVSKQVVGEVNAFLTLNNENLRGSLSLQSIIIGTNDAVQLLIDTCPQCLLQFGKDRFTRTDEWKFLIATVQRRILSLSQNDVLKRVCFFHKKLLKDILTYVATSMTLEQLVQVFPQRFSTSQQNGGDDNRDYVGEDLGYVENELDILNEIQNYEPFVIICRETMHANQINKLITTTGQQLLCTLNL